MFIPLTLAPGFYFNGTAYEAKGRYRTGDLVRWYAGSLQPIGGWRARSAAVLSGVSRAALTWSANDGTAWIGVGTNTHLYSMTRSGSLADITPLIFTPGPGGSVAGGGYGTGLYGVGLYGTVRLDSTDIVPAASWTLDTFGENLVGVMDSDQVIYEWSLDPMAPAVEVMNSPACSAVLVTQEGILMALGADDGTTVNPRYIKWSDIQDNTDWTPTATNQSRDYTLQTAGQIMCGKKVQGGVLILTDEGAFLGTYVGPPFVYVFSRVGSGCGVASRQAVAVTQSNAYWMGRNGFYTYNGFTQTLQCDVQDFVFSDINFAQIAKVSAVLNSDFNEVWWFYPSADSLEVNRYVAYNYLENIWYYGNLDRTCGTGSNGVLQYPIMIGTNGLVYDHEVDNFRDGRTATARTGPVEIGNGDNVIMLSRYVPDERNAGTVDVRFYARQWPNGDLTEYGPFDSTSPTDLRITARQMEVEYVVAADQDGRVGNFRFDARQGGRR